MTKDKGLPTLLIILGLIGILISAWLMSNSYTLLGPIMLCAGAVVSHKGHKLYKEKNPGITTNLPPGN